ncbi:MAG TPA: hypothetical protein VGN72_00560 [Tepidisphaeraceae bacterium]|nr:hypothetical protein [Tepidisphaeraceae bacterium]
MAISSDLEILISRYAEGDDTLTPAERQRVEQALDTDAEANELLAGEHRLTDLLRAAPLPDVNYELLAARISANIPQAAVQTESRPVTASRSFWSGSKLALAASVLIAAGVAIPMLNNDVERGNNAPVPISTGGAESSMTAVAPVTIRAVNGGTTSVAVTPADAPNVVIGPSPAVAGRPASDRYTEAPAGNRPAKVVISGENSQPTNDNPLAPR